MAALVSSLANGDSVPPVSVRVGTYLKMGPRSRTLLEPHLQILDVTCSPVVFFDGELLSQAVIPFEEYYRVMAYAIHEDQPGIAKRLFSKARAAPKTVSEIQTLFAKLPYKGAFGVTTRDQMISIFPMYQEFPPKDADLKDPLKDGRLKDYAMIKLFRVYGGELLLDRGCGPYELNPRFYKSKRVNTLFGEKDMVVVRREPFVHLMKTMGQQVTREDRTTFRIKNCTN
ncbi:hypothetical protein [Marinobacter sp.]|uniref:hypothetical protein n=1 Tax=Marinobacter sp. TaxID=50741 RepID=UPI003A94364B